MDKSKIQKDIVDKLPNPSHGILKLAPRVGKTKIGIDILKKEKPKKILWVTPNAKLRDIDIPAEFIQWKAKSYLAKTNIICYASLSGHTGNYDKVYLDEYQDLTESNSEPLFNGNITYNTILAFSGTHPKHVEKLDLYKRLKLDTLSEMNIDEAVDKGLIAPYRIKIIECELDIKDKYIKAGTKDKPFMQTEKSRYDYLSKLIRVKMFSRQPVPKFFYLNRMRFIYDLRSKTEFAKHFISSLSGRTLVFAGSIAQAEELCEYTYHSKKDDSDYLKFKNEKISTLAMVNSGGVGHTYRNVDNLVIVQVNSDRKGDATQKIARSLVLQDGYVANIYILCVRGTVDEDWKDKVLEGFDRSKVEHVSYKNYE